MAGPWRARRRWRRAPRLAAWAGVAVLFGCSLGCRSAWRSGRSRSWRFPDALPQSCRSRAGRITWAAGGPTWTTLAVGFAATSIAIAGCWLPGEREPAAAAPAPGAFALLYVPLLVPQIGFLFGVQVLWLGLADGWLAVIWTHLLFVLPYVFLTLADPYRSLDPRYARTALALGKPPWLVWLRIKLVMLLRPSDRDGGGVRSAWRSSCRPRSPAAAAGHARHRNLEPGRRRRSSDRRRVRLRLAVLPFVGFMALAATAWRFRHRRAMWVGS